MRKVFFIFAFLFSFSLEARAEWYSTDDAAYTACAIAANSAGLSCVGASSDFPPYVAAQSSCPAANIYMYRLFSDNPPYADLWFAKCTAGAPTCPSGSTFDGYLDQGGTGLCVASSSCTAGVNYGGSSGDSSLCINGCTATRGAVGLTLSGQSTSWTYTTTGVSCTGGSTATPLPTTVPGTTDCTKVTSLNGGISYDCGKSTSTSAATGVHCSQTASGYSCTGGDSGTKCWTDATGTINCTGKGATEEGVSTSTPIKTERSIKTDSTGARTETKVEHLPGGGWVRTDTTFDAAGNKTGETKESGSGVGGAKDGEGNEPGGGAGDGTGEPPAEPPSGVLPTSNITLPGFQSSSFLGGAAGCPSPASFTAFGGTYAVSFEPGCQAASLLRAILIAFSLFLAVRIFQGYVTEAAR